ncbi:MAG TPA: hypothetical protein VFE24_00815 [Pirellulales bacterium]|nr:hypothetical protein [Pirellulales bacterium]
MPNTNTPLAKTIAALRVRSDVDELTAVRDALAESLEQARFDELGLTANLDARPDFPGAIG